MSNHRRYGNESRVIPRFAPVEDAPVEDPHWIGGNDTINGYCEEGYEYVRNPRVAYGGYCRKKRRR